MKVRITGIADQTINVSRIEYMRAKEEKRLYDFMEPYIKKLEFEVTYAPAEDSD